ncbi:MAG: ABC transporter permease [Bryobacteraceae bacterium]|jgi:predicted permease
MILAQEIRFAARALAKNKGWTAVAALALALGLGANVAIFSVVGLMLWPPLPYPNPGQLVFITQTSPQRGISQAGASLEDARDWSGASAIASIAVYRSQPVALSGEGEPQHVPAMQVSPEFFPILGVRPAVGRVFAASEGPETESRAAVISHALWQGLFSGDRSVLGREVRLDGRNYSIVGVMPGRFHYLFQPVDIWIPLSLEPGQRARDQRRLSTVARLKAGVSVGAANAEVRAISARVEKEDPATSLHWRGDVRPLTARVINRGARAAAFSMFGGVGFVLLVACANVASLLLARGTQRRREFAVRASLGASRGSLIRLQLIENLLLSVIAGVVGVVSAIWTVPLLKRIAPPDMALFQVAGLDWSALAFGLALSVVTGVVCGVLPAWLLTRDHLALNLQSTSRGSTSGRQRLLKGLVAAEMALALVLVAASSLMIRSALRQTNENPGFDRSNLMAAQIMLPTARYAGRTQVVDFFAKVLENLRRDGVVDSAGLVQTAPLAGNSLYNRVRVEGETESDPDRFAGEMVVSPGYFRAMRIPLLGGRDFLDADRAGTQQVVIVNETFARRFWPKDPDPVGKRLQVGDGTDGWIAVVGLGRDVRHENLAEPPRPEFYRPHAQTGPRSMILLARGRSGLQSVAGALRSAVWQVDRDQPLFRLQSVEAWLYTRNSGGRATANVLGMLAAVALILAAVGTYGVMAYAAAQRMREIGIRLALGATREQVFRMMLRAGLTLGAVGVLVGLPAAYGVTPLLQAIDSGLDAGDGATYLGVAALLFAVALGASIVPAWRAMRVAPASVLRDEQRS